MQKTRLKSPNPGVILSERMLSRRILPLSFQLYPVHTFIPALTPLVVADCDSLKRNDCVISFSSAPSLLLSAPSLRLVAARHLIRVLRTHLPLGGEGAEQPARLEQKIA